jgi:glyoxylase-like metal-dependent hydrolase (beta-lactamase superfamily II)
MQPSVQEVAEDVYQFQIPLPFKLKEINVYLVKADDGCLLIDTGTNTPASAEALRLNLARLGVGFTDLRYVAITHFHSDHAGQAGLIQQYSDAQIIMHADSARFLQQWNDEEGHGPMSMAPDAFYRQHGLPPATIEIFRSVRQRYRTLTLPFRVTCSVEDGDSIEVAGKTYRMLFTPGHAIGHICVYCPQSHIAFTGDHILQRITPNISIHSDQHPLQRSERYNPLHDFFVSLEKMRHIDFTLGLPSHGPLLTDPAGRIDALFAHHNTRLQTMLEAISNGPRTAYAISRYAFPKYTEPFDHWLMLGETLAHLELLEMRQQIERTHDNGTILFRLAHGKH